MRRVYLRQPVAHISTLRKQASFHTETEAILAMVKRTGAHCVVVTDSDAQGRKAAAVTARLRASHVSIANAMTDSGCDLSLEDLLELEAYVAWVKCQLRSNN